MTARPPVIIIGMHRSGTSLVARLLERLGLFLGNEKDTNSESLFFQELNDWILCQAGAAWDHPLPTQLLIRDKEGCNLIVSYLKTVLNSSVSRSHFGQRQSLRLRGGFGIRKPWGWKDPRNTFTLPVWLKLFPDARVIHVRRHGVDVAQSLKQRGDARRKAMAGAFQILNTRNTMPPYGARAVESPRCLTLEDAFSLWEEYMATATGHVRQLNAQATELAYEDLMTTPRLNLERIAAFCDLGVSNSILDAVCREVDAGRAFAFHNDEKLRSFADTVSKRLAPYGYEVTRTKPASNDRISKNQPG